MGKTWQRLAFSTNNIASSPQYCLHGNGKRYKRGPFTPNPWQQQHNQPIRCLLTWTCLLIGHQLATQLRSWIRSRDNGSLCSWWSPVSLVVTLCAELTGEQGMMADWCTQRLHQKETPCPLRWNNSLALFDMIVMQCGPLYEAPTSEEVICWLVLLLYIGRKPFMAWRVDAGELESHPKSHSRFSFDYPEIWWVSTWLSAGVSLKMLLGTAPIISNFLWCYQLSLSVVVPLKYYESFSFHLLTLLSLDTSNGVLKGRSQGRI